MTAGSAIASRGRFDLIGRWADVPKQMRVSTPGPKRRLLEPEDCDGGARHVAELYASEEGRDARRCHELVPTAPERPKSDTWNVMSRPHIPKWYEGKAQLVNDWAAEEDLESEEILMGDQWWQVTGTLAEKSKYTTVANLKCMKNFVVVVKRGILKLEKRFLRTVQNARRLESATLKWMAEKSKYTTVANLKFMKPW
jgi:hypothetical protein